MKRLGHALDWYINVWGRFTFLLPFALGPAFLKGFPPLRPGFFTWCLAFGLSQTVSTLALSKGIGLYPFCGIDPGSPGPVHSNQGSDKKGGSAMDGTIRARVRRGMLEPVEKLELPEGKEVMITIIEVPSEADVDAFPRSFGGWKGTLDADTLLRNIRDSRQASTRPEPRL